MKFLKDLYHETLGELIEEIKDTVGDIKSELLQPLSEIVDEFKSLGISSHNDDDDDDEDFEGYDDCDSSSSMQSNLRPNKHTKITAAKKVATITIKGVYQMNGPKPFTRVIECSSPSETGYYSQMMGNKSRQAQWIQANFPGANVSKGFSMSINIK